MLRKSLGQLRGGSPKSYSQVPLWAQVVEGEEATLICFIVPGMQKARAVFHDRIRTNHRASLDMHMIAQPDRPAKSYFLTAKYAEYAKADGHQTIQVRGVFNLELMNAGKSEWPQKRTKAQNETAE